MVRGHTFCMLAIGSISAVNWGCLRIGGQKCGEINRTTALTENLGQ